MAKVISNLYQLFMCRFQATGWFSRPDIGKLMLAIDRRFRENMLWTNWPGLVHVTGGFLDSIVIPGF